MDNVVFERIYENQLVSALFELDRTKTEIANFLGLSRSTVSRRLEMEISDQELDEYINTLRGRGYIHGVYPGDIVEVKGERVIIDSLDYDGDYSVITGLNSNLDYSYFPPEIIAALNSVKVQFLILTDSLVFVRDGKPITVDKSYTFYEEIKSLLIGASKNNNEVSQTDYEDLLSWLDVKSQLQKFSNGLITIENGEVFINGVVFDNRLTYALLRAYESKSTTEFDKLCKFVEKIQKSESWKIRNRLYDFLEKNELDLDDQGRVLAYKVVRSDYFDKHSNTMDNSVGNMLKVQRHEVDDRDEVECSFGLHVCSKEYIPHFYSSWNEDRVLLVALEPFDFITAPSDYNFSKCRTLGYEVLEDITDWVKEQGWV